MIRPSIKCTSQEHWNWTLGLSCLLFVLIQPLPATRNKPFLLYFTLETKVGLISTIEDPYIINTGQQTECDQSRLKVIHKFLVVHHRMNTNNKQPLTRPISCCTCMCKVSYYVTGMSKMRKLIITAVCLHKAFVYIVYISQTWHICC